MPTRKTLQRALGLALVLACFATAALAQSQALGRRLTYQGRVPELAGEDVLVRFRLYDAAADPSTLLWGPEEHAVRLDTNGAFVAVLGETSLDLDDDQVPDLDAADATAAWWLHVEVVSAGSTVSLAPRRRIFPAFHAVSATTVVDGSITSGDIANDAVRLRHVDLDTVQAADFAAGGLVADRFEVGAITVATLAENSVGSTQLATGSVDASKIVNGSIISSDIASGAVTRPKLAANSVTTSKLQSGRTFPTFREAAVSSEKLAFTPIFTSGSPGVRKFCAISDIRETEFSNSGETLCRVTYNPATGVWTREEANVVLCQVVCF